MDSFQPQGHSLQVRRLMISRFLQKNPIEIAVLKILFDLIMNTLEKKQQY